MESVKVEPHEVFNRIFWIIFPDGSKRLATINLFEGKSVYGEQLIKIKGKEFRIWDPYRSKLAAAILKGIKKVPFSIGSKILYLGSATGTTVSHVSDIVGEEGLIYCIDFAPGAMRKLIENLCSYRTNLYPILADARFPERYRSIVSSVDFIYCDIAQPEQARILADNADIYLKDDGWIMLAIKSRSINVTASPKEAFKHEIEVLKKRNFKIMDIVRLEPYEKDHAMVTAFYSKEG
ncbi:MAG: fibrillarin-like rRNA/tRNA 2'-O-methyltransferase [Candidatus Bathyarchaeia archaeon]